MDILSAERYKSFDTEDLEIAQSVLTMTRHDSVGSFYMCEKLHLVAIWLHEGIIISIKINS